ncbi:MAG: alcohol dehydrogenase [Gemmataceae bacterium]
MSAFDYQPRTRAVFGPGSLERVGELARELGGSRALLVTDPGLEQAGHPQKAATCLRQAGLQVCVFDGLQENPTTEHVDAGVALARDFRPDLIVAVGGGSAMDCAKGINFLYTNGGRMHDYWGKNKARLPMLPSLAVPSTAGTGSEAQSYALITDPATHRKMACGDSKAAFRIAVLDPLVTMTQPARVTALTGLDALAHAVESYVTRVRNPISALFAREAWRLLSRAFPTVLTDPGNLQARAYMQLGAHLAGMAIENSMLGAAHALANPLTARYGLTHGLAVALVLPSVIRYNELVVSDLYEDLAAHLPGQGATPGEKLARYLCRCLDLAQLPSTLREAGVVEADLPLLASWAAEQWTAQFNPRPVGDAELLALYQAAYGNDAAAEG